MRCFAIKFFVNTFLSFVIFILSLSHLFAQVRWVETTQPDFADGYIDPNLYASWRANLDSNPGCVEWFTRFDLDNNGYPDFASADAGSPYSLRVWFVSAGGLSHSLYLPNGAECGNIDIADLNVDGYSELIHSGWLSGSLKIYWNSPLGFSSGDTTLLTNSRSEAVYVADVNRDGYLDIITGCDFPYPDGVTIHWGQPGFIYSSTYTTFIPTLAYVVHNFDCADIDGDSDLDIVCTPGIGGTYPIIENNLPDGEFTFHFLPAFNSNPYKHGLSVGDLDGDGDIDLIFTGYSSMSYSDILLNEGGWTFTRQTVNPGKCYGGSALYDFDEDGNLDILYFRGEGSASPEGRLVIYWNDGTGHFSDANRTEIGPFPVGASGGTVIDANNDGYVDIFVNERTAPYSYLFWGPDWMTCDSFPVAQDHHGIFREPGNIRDRSPSAFYESNIFDTGFPCGFCSGRVSWVAYDDRDYHNHPYSSLPDPVGSECRILARSGDTPTVGPGWTGWDTLTDGGNLPSSILGHRYIQYRAELWYSNVAYLPWLERIEFEFDSCCCASVESVWFWEETNCDGQNLVHICYILSSTCPESTYSINVRVSSDGGATWNVPVITLFDTAGDLGDNVAVGTHCFDWLMSSDFPGYEGYNFAVQIGIGDFARIFRIIDSVDISSHPNYGRGLGYGDGFYWIYDTDDGYVHKTECIDCAPIDSFFIGTGYNCDIDYSDGFVYFARADVDPNVVYRINVATLAEELIATLPVYGSGIEGVNVIGDSLLVAWYGTITLPNYLLYINLNQPFPVTQWETLLTSPLDSCRTIEGIAFAHGYLWGCNNNGKIVQICLGPPGYVGCYSVPAEGRGAEGLCWDGQFLWYHNFHGTGTRKIYKIKIWESFSDSATAVGPLDSDPPGINILCPITVRAGHGIFFQWSVEDSFWFNYPCSLAISGCGITERRSVTDTSFFWIAPNYNCSSCTLIVATRDSFCNWGYDTCIFSITGGCNAEITSASFFEETISDTLNLVRFCFTGNDPDGDSFAVEYRLSHNGTIIPLVSVYDTVSVPAGPHTGVVGNGEHCIVWDMRQDLPNVEGCDFQFKAIISNQVTNILTVTDSIYLRYAEGVAWDGTYLWLSISRHTASAGGDTQCIYKVDPVTHEFLYTCCWPEWEGLMADMEYHDGYIWWMGGSFGSPSVRARFFKIDPVACAKVDSGGPFWGGSTYGQGLTYYNDYFWANNSRGFIYRIDSSPPYNSILWLSLNDTSLAYGGDSIFFGGEISADGMCFANGYFWVIRNATASYSYILWKFDTAGTAVDSFLLPANAGTGPEGIAFDGTCFWYADHDRDKFYRICNWGCVDTLTYTGCLDSRPPFVNINCPGETLFSNATVPFHWTVIDSFFTLGIQCTLFVHYCGCVDIFVLYDTTFNWVVPDTACDDAFVVVVVPDSFYNLGYDTSCTFTIVNDLEGPTVNIISPAPWSISACDTQVVYFQLYDASGIDTNSIRVSVNGVTYPILMDWVYYSPSESLLSVALLSAGIATDTVIVCLVGAIDIIGNPLDVTLCDTFIFDLDPPTISVISPLGVTGDTLADIVFTISDEHGVTLRYILVNDDTIEIYYFSGDTVIIRPEENGVAFADSGSVGVCVSATDSSGFCSENNTVDTCWSFSVFARGVWAEMITPPNGVYSSCDAQQVIWLLHNNPVESTIVVSVNGMPYTIDSPELSVHADTLIFQTNWQDSENVLACLVSAETPMGISLAETVCVSFTIDLSPPRITLLHPLSYCLDSARFSLAIEIFDTLSGICNYYVVANGQIVDTIVSGTGFEYDTLILSFGPFHGGDTLDICVTAGDCAQLCGANDTLVCWQRCISSDGPNVEVIYPFDGAVSSCDDQGAVFILHDSTGIDASSIWATVNDIPISASALDFDGETLLVNFPAVTFSNGDTVTVCAGAADVLGNPSDTICVTYIIDIAPPLLSSLSPFDTVYDFRPNISIDITDEIAGVSPSSLSMTINGGQVSAVWNGTTLYYQPDTNFICGLSIQICVSANDTPYFCLPNGADTCWSFVIPCLPNLWLENLSLLPSNTVMEGIPIRFIGVGRNDSVVSVGPHQVGVYVNSQCVGFLSMQGLLIWGAESLEWILDTLPAGEYQLCFHIDDYPFVIAESNENDNRACITLHIIPAQCDVHPNPFTPDGDGINELAKFEFPGKTDKNSSTQIEIYDLKNRLVRKLVGGVHLWDGKDTDGNPMPKGIYLYLITKDGIVICYGTVYLAR